MHNRMARLPGPFVCASALARSHNNLFPFGDKRTKTYNSGMKAQSDHFDDSCDDLVATLDDVFDAIGTLVNRPGTAGGHWT